jgi:ribosome-binding protein aMBF1 (putative translation factor)
MKVDIYADRVNRGLSQEQLAAEIGVSVDVVRNLEATGNRPRPSNALAVATFYGTTVTDMWPGTVEAAA